jgi:hypothetical protein
MIDYSTPSADIVRALADTSASFSSGDVEGIFDQFAEVIDDDGSERGTVVRRPQFTAASADLDGPTEGDSVSIDGTDYFVTTVLDDGMGVVVLGLRLAS